MQNVYFGNQGNWIITTATEKASKKFLNFRPIIVRKAYMQFFGN